MLETGERETGERETGRAFIDLHCHTNASFDSLSRRPTSCAPRRTRGLTHLIVSDHDRIDGALRARDAAPDGLTVIVGEEVKTADGDLICAFLEQAIPPGHVGRRHGRGGPRAGRARRGPASVRSIPGLARTSEQLAAMAPLLDWVEIHNARVVGNGNE